MAALNSMYAFVSVDADGTESICSVSLDGAAVPMIATNEKQLAKLRPLAKALSWGGEMKVRLVTFRRDQVEDFMPRLPIAKAS